MSARVFSLPDLSRATDLFRVSRLARACRVWLASSDRTHSRDTQAASKWVWQPDMSLTIPPRTSLGSGLTLAPGMTVFHDGVADHLALRSGRGVISAQTYAFAGSYVSFAFALPGPFVSILQRRPLLRISATLECTCDLSVFARLNVVQGPNRDNLVLERRIHSAQDFDELDLALLALPHGAFTAAWLDLIFARPVSSRIIIRDLRLQASPRAEL